MTLTQSQIDILFGAILGVLVSGIFGFVTYLAKAAYSEWVVKRRDRKESRRVIQEEMQIMIDRFQAYWVNFANLANETNAPLNFHSIASRFLVYPVPTISSHLLRGFGSKLSDLMSLEERRNMAQLEINQSELIELWKFASQLYAVEQSLPSPPIGERNPPTYRSPFRSVSLVVGKQVFDKCTEIITIGNPIKTI